MFCEFGMIFVRLYGSEVCVLDVEKSSRIPKVVWMFQNVFGVQFCFQIYFRWNLFSTDFFFAKFLVWEKKLSKGSQRRGVNEVDLSPPLRHVPPLLPLLPGPPPY